MKDIRSASALVEPYQRPGGLLQLLPLQAMGMEMLLHLTQLQCRFPQHDVLKMGVYCSLST
jgi:hypothetical protein